MQYQNPLILRFDAAYALPPPVLYQLEVEVNIVLLAGDDEITDATTRVIDYMEENEFAAVITNTKHYRVCHVYDKYERDLIIGISTEVEQ